MWKVLLLLACVAGSTICDDSLKDDCVDTDSSFIDVSSSSSSSSSSASSSSISEISSSSHALTSSSRSSSSTSESMSTSSSSSKTSQYTKSRGSKDNAVSGSNSVVAGGSAQGSVDSGSSDNSNWQELTPTYKCGPNEVFSNCTNGGCDARNCSQAGKPVACVKLDPKNCKKGCVCAEGYLRTAKGICVPRFQCSEGCGYDANSHPGCGVNCGRTCSTYMKKDIACIQICYENACDCNDGYVYDPNVEKCVLPKYCTPTCGLNEVYTTCSNGGCSRRNCSQLSQPQICIDRTPESCTKGCVCADGYLRNANGTCVLESQCPQSGCGGDPYAQAGCGYNCGKKCSDYMVKNKSLLCPRIQCTPNKCDCKDGYVFDDNLKKCVLPEQCTPICGLNEQYDSCTNGGCGHKNCSQIGTPEICINRLPDSCTKGCVCTSGYLRADNGTCVPQEQCPANGCGGDPNSHSGCGVNCGKTCNKNAVCLKICKVGGCDCNDGFLYDANLQKCVLPKDCTPTCGLNEVFSSCTNGYCGRRNCSELAGPIKCVDPIPGSCRKGCVCANGYLRADNGTCVPQDQCPLTACGNDPHAHSGCGVNCGRTCSTYNSTKPIACPAICIVGGCDCNDGYVFDNSVGKCVLPKDCSQPSTPPTTDDQCPGLNEFYDTCISGCSNQTCDSRGKIIHCPIQPAVCREGCRCKPGFYRNTDNVCVAESECPTPTCPEGETYNTCPTVPCDGDYCPKDKNSPQTCPVGIVCDKPRCTCGLLDKRDKNGKCIKAYSCPPFKCDSGNEHYDSCPAGCPGEKCSDYVSGSKCPPFRIGIVVPCRPACRCNTGYYRNSNNICVKADKCGPVVTTTQIPVSLETTTTAKPSTSSGGNDGLVSLQIGVTNFNGKFLYDRMNAEQGKNLITSPYSVFTPLVQLALCATGDSLKQLTSVLNVSTKDQIRSAYPALVASFEGQTSVNFSAAAKIYGDEKYPFSDDFLKDSRLVHADAQNVDFSKSAEAANIINAWVESQTNNLIHDLIQSTDLSSLTRLVLVNAIYFKGQWHYAFNKNATIKDADFYLSDGSTKKTQLMFQERAFNYGEVPELDCKVLQMFYKGDNFSMVVVLPNKNDGVLGLAEKLQKQPNFDKIMGSMNSQKVKVYLPPFSVTTMTDLSGILKQMGVTKIFNTTNSGLLGILKTNENLYVSKAVQKAFIEVNEEGSEAAAANGVIVSTRALPAPPPLVFEFRADRPFLFYIRLKDTTMFCGVKNDI